MLHYVQHNPFYIAYQSMFNSLTARSRRPPIQPNGRQRRRQPRCRDTHPLGHHRRKREDALVAHGSTRSYGQLLPLLTILQHKAFDALPHANVLRQLQHVERLRCG